MRKQFQAEAGDAGKRLDRFLTDKLQTESRARVQQLLRDGRVSVEGARAKASHRLRGGEAIAMEWEARPPLRAFPEDIPLEVLYEDEDLIAVNKPAGMPVHAGAGRQAGTLVNALLHRFDKLSQLGGELRPGIVHRLDRLTSGVLLAAKNDPAHRALAEQFRRRQVEKTYIALVQGSLEPERGRISAPIARDLLRRRRMTARRRSGREALTEYRVLRRWPGYTLLEVRIHTGRTHQIRVHLSNLGHPVAGDTLYGARGGLLARNFLHAARIRFRHPRTGTPLEFSAPLPPELQAFLDGLARGSVVK
jgi:23S rRNA pseudouridine1911/1915/1917 synthase